MNIILLVFWVVSILCFGFIASYLIAVCFYTLLKFICLVEVKLLKGGIRWQETRR